MTIYELLRHKFTNEQIALYIAGFEKQNGGCVTVNTSHCSNFMLSIVSNCDLIHNLLIADKEIVTMLECDRRNDNSNGHIMTSSTTLHIIF